MKKLLIIFTSILLLAASINAADSLQIYLQKGGKGLTDKDYQKAIDNYKNALKLRPDHFSAMRNLGVAHSAVGNQELAKDLFLKAFKINSVDADLNNNLGAIYSNENNPNQAIQFFKKAVGLEPYNPVYLSNLGREYAKGGQIDMAIEILHKADSIMPNNAITLFSLGSSFAGLKKLDSAEFYFEKSVAAKGKDSELFYFLGRIKQDLGKKDEAISNYKKALTYRQNYRDCMQSLALIYFYDQEYSPAIEGFKYIVSQDSLYYAGWIGLGASYSLNGFVPQADSILSFLFDADSTMGFQMLNLITSEYKKQNK